MNSSGNFSCIWTTKLASFTDTASFLTYTALAPAFFILGMIGHVLALIAFAKQETAYAYQVFVTIIKTVEIIFFDLFVLCFINLAGRNWSGQIENAGRAWFRSNYPLMWFTARVTTVLQSASITLPLLATTAMTIDRTLGLVKPIFYATMNKKKHQNIAYFLCCFVGLVISLDCGYRWEVIENPHGQGYLIESTGFSKTPLGAFFGQSRNAIRIITEFVLISSSIANVYFYAAYVKKNNSLTSSKEAKQASSKANEKMMATLATYQSISTVSTTVLLVGYTIANYLSTTFAKCDGEILGTIIDFTLQLVNAIDFFILYMANHQFRAMINRLFKPTAIVQVVPVGQNRKNHGQHNVTQ